jgi:tRNA dimethylallyltransferase
MADRPDQRKGAAVAVAVVGPTATGKSDLGVALALELGGEVVNADSMQLYRGMDIGTAKLSPAERRGVPHHLLDVLDLRDEASVAAYQREAVSAVESIADRGHVPVLVGGSGLYVSAVVDALDFPGTDPLVRERLEAELAASGPATLHARLAVLDPAAAAAILPGNGRRIVRALEVVELTGHPYKATLPAAGDAERAAGAAGAAGVRWLRLGVTGSRPALDERIVRRVDRMWTAGLVEEVRELERAGLRDGRTASRALGYAQVLRMLDGRFDEEQARAEVVASTRRYVRRQESWFRRDRSVRWLAYDDPGLVGSALAALATAGS